MKKRYYTAQRVKELTWKEKIATMFSTPGKIVLIVIFTLLLIAFIVGLCFLLTVRSPELPIEEPTIVDTVPENIEPEDKTQEDKAPEDDLTGLEQPELGGDRRKDVYTFLVLGTDKSDSNTDTIMVATYDVPNQNLNLISIPRDTMVNVRWDIKRINSVYGMQGLEGLRKQIGKLLGFKPDFYVKVDLEAFVKLVDLIEGVRFDVPRDMDYDDPVQDLHIHLKEGEQVLDGEQAMGVVRWRHNNDYTRGYSDEERIATQQAFLKAVMEQCLTFKNWTKVKGMVDIFYEYVESDLAIGEMLWFGKQAMGLDADGFRTFSMPGNYGAAAWSRAVQGYQSYVLPYASELIEIVNAYFNPYEEKVTRSMLDIMSINADGSLASSSGVLADPLAAEPHIPEETTEDAEGTEEEDGTEDEDGTVPYEEGSISGTHTDTATTKKDNAGKDDGAGKDSDTDKTDDTDKVDGEDEEDSEGKISEEGASTISGKSSETINIL